MGARLSAIVAVCTASIACGSGGSTPPDAGADASSVDSSGDVAPPADSGADAIPASDAGDAGPKPTPLAVCPPATKATRYVSPTGSDGNSGGATSPFLTIQHAIDVSGAGDVVHVLGGTYTGTTSPLAYVRSTTSGTSTEPVVFCSDPPGAAKLDGQSTLSTGFYLEGTFVRVLGFEVTGFTGAGVSVYGNGGTLVGNVIHDIGHVCTDSDLGKVGVYTSTTNVTINANVIHTIGRLSPGEQGCNPTTTNYQNHDHGIYVESSTNVVVTNNVFYDNQHGWDIHVYSSSGPGSSGLTIANNTFAFPNPYRDGQVLLSTPSVSNAIVENNVFYEPQTEGVNLSSGASLSGVTVKNNVTTGAVTLASIPSGVTAAGNQDNVDASLVSPTTDDFHLQASSPAIDHGLSISAVTTDIEGTTRPQGPAFDVGAYEWH